MVAVGYPQLKGQKIVNLSNKVTANWELSSGNKTRQLANRYIITPVIPSREFLQTAEQGNADGEQTDL